MRTKKGAYSGSENWQRKKALGEAVSPVRRRHNQRVKRTHIEALIHETRLGTDNFDRPLDKVRTFDSQRILADNFLSRHEARALCIANGIGLPARFEQRPLPADEIPDEDILSVAKDIWLVTHRNKKTGAPRKRVKVEYKSDEQRWTCSCSGWIKKRDVDCIDIYTIKRRKGLATDPFKLARRRGPTYYLYPDGTPCEDTRRKHARTEIPTRLPWLAESICVLYAAQQPHNTRGPIKWIALQAYALLIKVAFNFSLSQLAAWLSKDEALWRLGWRKPNGPSESTLSNWFGELLPFAGMIASSAFPGNRLDDTLTGDAFDIPTLPSQNSRDLKFGPKPPSYRVRAPLIRQHFAKGKISKLIYALDTTLNKGPGAGEGAHLPALMVRAKDSATGTVKAIYDRGYDSNRNFKMLDDLRIQLYVLEKANENRLNGKWCPAAEKVTILQRDHYPEFHEEMRFRPETEEVGSAVMRRTPRIRLRRRKSDPNAQAPVDYDDDDRISHLPEELIAAILDAAQENVGIARLNESRAIIIVANLVRLIVLEHLHDDRVNFSLKRDFNPIPTVKQQDLRQAA